MDFHISQLQMRPLMQVLEDRLARLEDRLEDQHEEIAILRGQMCHCGQQGDPLVKLLISEGLTKTLAPPVSLPIASSSSEEEERSKLDYANDPPVPHVEGTAQGDRSVEPVQLSKANPLVVDWDGTLSKYLTPHLTPEASLNVLIPLPGRWSGGHCLCIPLITSYRF